MKLVEIAQQLTPEQTEWINNVVKGKWVYENGKVDVEGKVDFSNKKLTNIPVQFGYVSGHFHCNDNKLTSLAGAPREVGGDFNCSYNKLTSLAGAPKEVGGELYCVYNKFKSKPDTSLIKIGGKVIWK